jgi:transcriptional regulator with XRE-family HTH domain
MDKAWKPELRKHIGQKIRQLRKQRSLSQDQLARQLGVSQAWLSYVEKGEGSLSAEQFLEVLRIFNEIPQSFDLAQRDPETEFQRALAQQGAGHLFQDARVLPSGLNQDIEATIREVLLDGRNPRQITAIAPVLVRQHDRIDLKRLWARFVDYRLENRLGWVLESVAEALGQITPGLSSYRARPLRKAEAALRNFLAIRQPEHPEAFRHLEIGPEAPKSPTPEQARILSLLDVLGDKSLSWKTLRNLWASADAPSRRWGIISSLKTQDFCDALQAGLDLQGAGVADDTV